MRGHKDHLAAAIVSLRVDHVLGEVADAFAAADVDWLLLKGPAIRQRLYGEETRDYRDLDLLVDPAHEHRAYDALRGLGLSPREGFGDPETIALHHEWRRGEDIVEVHVNLSGIDAPAAQVWTCLSAHRRAITVGGREVWALDDAAMALHLALHAAQHGIAIRKGIDDLQRGLTQLPREAWVQAGRLADELGAAPAFAAALDLAPASTSWIPTSAPPTTEWLLRSQSAGPIAIGLARAGARAGPRAWLHDLRRLLFPTRQFLRRWAAVDRGRPAPYPLAYAWRMLYLLRHGPGGVRAWWCAARAVRRQGRG